MLRKRYGFLCDLGAVALKHLRQLVCGILLTAVSLRYPPLLSLAVAVNKLGAGDDSACYAVGLSRDDLRIGARCYGPLNHFIPNRFYVLYLL
jgi:hypothetical protein